MGNPAGVRRDFEALEQRRREAAELLRQGVHQAEVARRVGAHRQSVSRWARQLEQGGMRALKKASTAGRKSRLRPEDLRRIERGLKRGPQGLGYETNLWTSWRVAHLIEHTCGVKYHPSQAWRILRQLGWSCQRPTTHGTSLGTGRRKDSAVEAGTLAGDKKNAEKQGRTIVFIDESGLSQRPHRCRTWAPRGQTPVLQYHFNWKTLSAMAGVTWWNFYFRLFPGSIRSPQVVEFLSHLLRHIPGRLLVVWDGLKSHRGRMVWDFVREQQGRIWLEFLPAYAPELNPVEYLWSHWKQHELPNFCPKTFGELSHYARKALSRMRKRPTLVTAFWQQADLFPL
jgi:transposase